MERVTAERLLFEVDDLLRTMPSAEEFHEMDDPAISWAGRAQAAVAAWDGMLGVMFANECSRLISPSMQVALRRSVAMTLRRMQHDLRMRTSGPMSVAVNAGSVFEYFDELRKIIQGATIDLLFVDPYLDADFVSAYLPHASAGVRLRLLTSDKKLTTLLSAISFFRSQHKTSSIEVKVTAGLHDRYVIVDSSACYQSGASFKDGARAAPTTLTQITDAFDAVKSAYEKLWSTATTKA